MTVPQPPAPAQWPPPPQRPTRRPYIPTVLVGVLAVAALIVVTVALITRTSPPPAPIASPTPTSTPISTADQMAAKKRACKAAGTAVDVVDKATHAPADTEPAATWANARTAIETATLLLSRSTSAATPPEISKAVKDLADAFSNYLLSAFSGDVTQNNADHAAILKKTDALAALCNR